MDHDRLGVLVGGRVLAPGDGDGAPSAVSSGLSRRCKVLVRDLEGRASAGLGLGIGLRRPRGAEAFDHLVERFEPASRTRAAGLRTNRATSRASWHALALRTLVRQLGSATVAGHPTTASAVGAGSVGLGLG